MADSFGERLALDELEDQILCAVNLFQVVDDGDVGMVERREHVCLALEARQPFRVLREGVGQHLNRHVAPEVRVVSAIDLAIPPKPIKATISYGPRRVPGASDTFRAGILRDYP